MDILVTEHQNNVQPQVVSFSLDKNVISGKVFRDPQGILRDYTEATISFQSNINFLKCYIRATKIDDEYDTDVGTLIYELEGTALNPRPAHTTFSTIIKTSDLLEGDGLYRISIYILDINKVWNYEYCLLDKYEKQIIDSEDKIVYVEKAEF